MHCMILKVLMVPPRLLPRSLTLYRRMEQFGTRPFRSWHTLPLSNWRRSQGHQRARSSAVAAVLLGSATAAGLLLTGFLFQNRIGDAGLSTANCDAAQPDTRGNPFSPSSFKQAPSDPSQRGDPAAATKSALALHSNSKPITITNQSTRPVFVARYYGQCYTVGALDVLEHVLAQARSATSAFSSLSLPPLDSSAGVDPQLILDPIRQLIKQPLSQAIGPAPAHKLAVTVIPPGEQCTVPAIDPDLLPHLCLSEMLVFSDRPLDALPVAGSTAPVNQVSIEFVDELVIQRDERGRLEALTPVDVALRGWAIDLVNAVGKRILSREALDQIKRGMQDRARFPELDRRVQAWESQRASMQEASHVHARRNGVVKQALEELVGRKVEEHEVPVVAVAMSGGGYRAMLAAAGFLQGLSDTGLLPLTTYMAALSGSTYTLTQWLLTSPPSPSRLVDVMTPRLQLDLQDLLITADGSQLVTTLTPLIQKQLLNQPMSLADFFGCLVAAQLVHPLLPSTKHYPTMSDLAAHVDPQIHPWPLFTAVSHDLVSDKYAWVEFDPVNANVMWFDHRRPSWVARVPMVGVGREFVDGSSVELLPELPLSSLLGLWGSAFSGTVAQGWAELKTGLFASPAFSQYPPNRLITRLDSYFQANPAVATEHPIPPTYIPNPWYDPRRTGANALATQPALSLMDAGLVCNLPVPTLVHPSRSKKVDVILVLDSSSDIGQPSGVPNMRILRDFAREWGVKGLGGDDEAVWAHVMRVGGDTAAGKCDQPVYVLPGSPTLVYVPLLPETGVEDEQQVDVNQSSWCGTGNFVYSEEQARSVVQMVRDKVVRGRADIVRAIVDKCTSNAKQDRVLGR